jgi:hypothetical protein
VLGVHPTLLKIERFGRGSVIVDFCILPPPTDADSGKVKGPSDTKGLSLEWPARFSGGGGAMLDAQALALLVV